MESLDVKEGWNCLEIGGGGGSVARWLSTKVGKSGRVLVTDINPLFLNELKGKTDNVDVLIHDITNEVGLPKNTFDLAHARLVLIHLPQRQRALANMISSLKPGGVVLIEDFDLLVSDFTRDYHPKLGVPPTMATEIFRKTLQARNTLLQRHGADLNYARNLYSLFRANGLVDVGFSTGGFRPWQSGTAGAQLNVANTIQSGEEIIESGLMSEKELEDAIKLMRDPEWIAFSPLMISAWGRKKS
jgi:SAM-dependent methyltransferase